MQIPVLNQHLLPHERVNRRKSVAQTGTKHKRETRRIYPVRVHRFLFTYCSDRRRRDRSSANRSALILDVLRPYIVYVQINTQRTHVSSRQNTHSTQFGRSHLLAIIGQKLRKIVTISFYEALFSFIITNRKRNLLSWGQLAKFNLDGTKLGIGSNNNAQLFIYKTTFPLVLPSNSK